MTDTSEIEHTSTSSPCRLEILGNNEESPTEYTFVPRDVDTFDQSTRWLTADANAVVNLMEYQ